jgi:hypothetical protein
MPGDAEDLPPAITKLGRHFRLTEAHIWDGWYAAGADVSHRSWHSDDIDSGVRFLYFVLCFFGFGWFALR